MDKPEALRLADALDECKYVDVYRCKQAASELRRLHAELERERMRLAACGVVALADTPDSAKHARQMHPDYESAACQDVARRVDECISLRTQRDALLEALRRIGQRCPRSIMKHPPHLIHQEMAHDAGAWARAAIKAAEGENHAKNL